MKNNQIMILFLSTLLLSFTITSINSLANKETEKNLKTSESSSVSSRKFSQAEEELMKQMFSTPPTTCGGSGATTRSQIAAPAKKGKDFIKASKSELYWVKNWGFGNSAYLFDYLSPVFKVPFVNEAKKIYSELKAINNKKDGIYTDPFDYMNFITPEMSNAEKEKILSNLKNINSNYVKEIYDISINAVQLHYAMKKWKWVVDSTVADYAMDFLMKYDGDGDGRLNMREIILGVIDHNQSIIGNSGVKNAFEGIFFKINAMFTFIDCNGDGYVSAEEMWKNLKTLKRGDANANKFNIFGLNEGLRTSAINDFVLKSHESKNGLLSKPEFVSGVLFGFWNRQIEPTKILDTDDRSLIKLRWVNEIEDKHHKQVLAANPPKPEK